MTLKIQFEAVNQGNHGAPRTLLTREYNNGNYTALLPKENDRLLIQWGRIRRNLGFIRLKVLDMSSGQMAT